MLAAAGLVVGAERSRRRRADARPAPQYHRITFPVTGTVHYSDDFGDCRDGCTRHHEGNDLMGAKLMHELAANDGTIAFAHADSSGTAGNMLILTGNDGWEYWYIHINNDTPGTDDGKNPARVALRARHPRRQRT